MGSGAKWMIQTPQANLSVGLESLSCKTSLLQMIHVDIWNNARSKPGEILSRKEN